MEKYERHLYEQRLQDSTTHAAKSTTTALLLTQTESFGLGSFALSFGLGSFALMLFIVVAGFWVCAYCKWLQNKLKKPKIDCAGKLQLVSHQKIKTSSRTGKEQETDPENPYDNSDVEHLLTVTHVKDSGNEPPDSGVGFSPNMNDSIVM